MKTTEKINNRINQLKKQKESIFGDKDTKDGMPQQNGPIRGNFNTKTINFYEHTYDRLIEELENLLND